jgi:hypothetical protein
MQACMGEIASSVSLNPLPALSCSLLLFNYYTVTIRPLDIEEKNAKHRARIISPKGFSFPLSQIHLLLSVQVRFVTGTRVRFTVAL